MKKFGFLISKKENEKRRALTFNDIQKIINKKNVYFEKNYFKEFGYTDDDILKTGCNVVEREEIYKCDIICDPKIGDSDELEKLNNKTVFGWIHATQNYDITEKFINNKLTGYAWEKMFDRKRHIFDKNNQIAGEAAILHAMVLYGKLFNDLNIAILGNGNTSKGAQKILNKFDSNIDIYTSKDEEMFKIEMHKYDVIVNCILWDVTRKDHIIYKEDLKKLKKGSLIIDVSCDKNGGIETSFPTTIEDPIYIVEDIYHYVVDHTPSLLYKDASEYISKELVKFVDDLIEGNENNILDKALIINNGNIIDEEINKFQNRK